MLKEIEQQVATIVGKALPDVAVTVAPPQALADGAESVTIALRQLGTSDAFQHEQQSISNAPPGLRRLFPVTFTLRIAVRVKPSANAAAAARERVLEYVARIAHTLGDPKVRTGRSFAPGDSVAGFAVESFVLVKATVADTATEDVLAAELRYHGSGSIWPLDGELEPVRMIEEVISDIEAVES